jgi:putative membrane protein
MMGFGMGFGILGLLFMFLFWGALILFVVWLFRAIGLSVSNSQSSPTQQGKAANALEILDRRYANGEITREQYMAMKQDLI